MRTNGSTEHAIKLMYTNQPINKKGFPNPQGEPLGVLTQTMHIHQLNPGQANLAQIQERARVWIDGRIRFDHMIKACSYAASKSATHIELPLYRWVSDFFINLGQHVYFGETIEKNNPETSKEFYIFDELVWKLLYQYPSMLSQDMAVGRAGVVNALCRYLETPKDERSDAAWLIRSLEDEMRAIGVEQRDMAIVFFHLYIAQVFPPFLL